MKFLFLFGGRKKADFFQKGIDEYVGRIRKVFAVELHPGKKDEEISRFLANLPRGSHLIGLAEGGKEFTSVAFAGFLKKLMERGTKEVVFLIGGADGFNPVWRERCDTMFSLSPLTFSHQLSRLVLVEQVYRALSIIHNRPYHR
ncbi:MAG: 23S rRNA (pseudouridine(1915)-N(3))-methyltransferase RlmH [Deltaproteobacteria bacterium]|nr:23S rRNA (pseudouridine(1915)-N(3))-methyltransferase RlmH [Deltaproteobacteria bacterium]